MPMRLANQRVSGKVSRDGGKGILRITHRVEKSLQGIRSHYSHVPTLSDLVHNPYTHDAGHSTSNYFLVLYGATCTGSMYVTDVLCGFIPVGA
jgi:hypothetical protein